MISLVIKTNSKMYPNPFERKHSTIRQVIDRFLKPDSNSSKRNKWLPKSDLERHNSSRSSSSNGSTKTFSSTNHIKHSFMFAIKTWWYSGQCRANELWSLLSPNKMFLICAKWEGVLFLKLRGLMWFRESPQNFYKFRLAAMLAVIYF